MNMGLKCLVVEKVVRGIKMSEKEIDMLKIGDVISDNNYFFFDVTNVYYSRGRVSKVVTREQWKDCLENTYTRSKIFLAEDLKYKCFKRLEE